MRWPLLFLLVPLVTCTQSEEKPTTAVNANNQMSDDELFLRVCYCDTLLSIMLHMNRLFDSLTWQTLFGDFKNDPDYVVPVKDEQERLFKLAPKLRDCVYVQWNLFDRFYCQYFKTKYSVSDKHRSFHAILHSMVEYWKEHSDEYTERVRQLCPDAHLIAGIEVDVLERLLDVRSVILTLATYAHVTQLRRSKHIQSMTWLKSEQKTLRGFKEYVKAKNSGRPDVIKQELAQRLIQIYDLNDVRRREEQLKRKAPRNRTPMRVISPEKPLTSKTTDNVRPTSTVRSNVNDVRRRTSSPNKVRQKTQQSDCDLNRAFLVCEEERFAEQKQRSENKNETDKVANRIIRLDGK